MITRPKKPEDRSYFFDQGILFGCTQCGRCCTGEPGKVHMNVEEGTRIAHRLGMSHVAFLERYAYPAKGGHSLKEVSDGRCVFFEDGMCSIYDVRPTQCRTYPFWSENLRSERAWAETIRECPGIGKGRLYAKAEILHIAGQSLDRQSCGNGTGPQPTASV